MIQRLVTSNPSPAYVGRVAAGVRQQRRRRARRSQGGVDRHPHRRRSARRCPAADDTLSGKLREPVVRFVQWARTVGITSDNGDYEIYDLSGTRHRARPEPAALAVGVQLLPPRLRAAEHRHRHGRQAGAGIPVAQRNHHRRLHQLHAVRDAQRLQRRQADLRGAAADRARRRRRWSPGSTCGSRPTSCRPKRWRYSGPRSGRSNITAGEHRQREARHAGHRLLPHPLLARIPGAEMSADRGIALDPSPRPAARRAAWLRWAWRRRSPSISPPSARPRPSTATDYKALVCVFLYGGNDYANTVVPYDPTNYALYHQIRAGDRRRRPGRYRARARGSRCRPRSRPLVAQVLTDNLQYALAPQLAGLKSLCDAGQARGAAQCRAADPADHAARNT